MHHYYWTIFFPKFLTENPQLAPGIFYTFDNFCRSKNLSCTFPENPVAYYGNEGAERYGIYLLSMSPLLHTLHLHLKSDITAARPTNT